jgi:error-prone DNA polymerase
VPVNFTHLRTCSGYSFKYGTATAKQLVDRAAEFGMQSLALTDRENMAGAIKEEAGTRATASAVSNFN